MLGLRRSTTADAELRAVGIQPCSGDVTRPEALSRLPGPFDWVVNCVSSTKGGVEEYREVYVNGSRNLIEWLGAASPKKFVYTSSTSVYGQTDGSLVKEDSVTEPASETSKLLVERRSCSWPPGHRKNSPPSSCGWPAFMAPSAVICSDNTSRIRQRLRAMATASSTWSTRTTWWPSSSPP